MQVKHWYLGKYLERENRTQERRRIATQVEEWYTTRVRNTCDENYEEGSKLESPGYDYIQEYWLKSCQSMHENLFCR